MYQPNFSDARVGKRIKKALAFTVTNMSPTVSYAVSAHKINKAFGSKGHPLADWLRTMLFVKTFNYSTGMTVEEHGRDYEAHYCYYKSLPLGINYIAELLISNGIKPAIDLDDLVLFSKQESQIREAVRAQLDAKVFVYNDKSSRLWHPLQMMSRMAKKTFWTGHGFSYNYDISAAAPTLLKQLALYCECPIPLVAGIDHYLNNKNLFRRHIAALSDLSYDDAKTVINSLFNGAELSANPYKSIFDMLGEDVKKMERLKTDPMLSALRDCIKTVWKYIERRYPVKTSKEKWAVYFALERQVLDVIRLSLDEQGVFYFCEHDGFICDREVDLQKLQCQIKALTKYNFTVEIEAGWKE
jgi:hypothetical protein